MTAIKVTNLTWILDEANYTDFNKEVNFLKFSTLNSSNSSRAAVRNRARKSVAVRVPSCPSPN